MLHMLTESHHSTAVMVVTTMIYVMRHDHQISLNDDDQSSHHDLLDHATAATTTTGKVRATTVTLVRRTPSICAMYSWVSGSSSPPCRSAALNSHRDKRLSMTCVALQAADCCACASSACS